MRGQIDVLGVLGIDGVAVVGLRLQRQEVAEELAVGTPLGHVVRPGAVHDEQAIVALACRATVASFVGAMSVSRS